MRIACAILATLVATSALPALTSPVTAQEGRLWVIFVDDLHLDFRSTGRLRELLKTVCTELVADGDLTGIVSTGPSSITVDLTADGPRILKAIPRLTGSGLAPVDLLATPQTARSPTDERVYRAAVSTITARDTLTGLAKVQNRRKALIYVSNGYDVVVSAAGSGSGRRIDLTAGPLLRLTAADVGEQLSDFADEAWRSNVEIFAIDGRRVVDSTPLDPRVDKALWQNYWATTRKSLRAISERTGGFAILEEDELVNGLQAINAAMRR